MVCGEQPGDVILARKRLGYAWWIPLPPTCGRRFFPHWPPNLCTHRMGLSLHVGLQLAFTLWDSVALCLSLST